MELQHGFARRTFGIIFILITVILWTASNFLASTIFADDSFSKPYFITYFNTATFVLFLAFRIIGQPLRKYILQLFNTHSQSAQDVSTADEARAFLPQDANDTSLLTGLSRSSSHSGKPTIPLTTKQTLRLALEFCLLWFLANYTQSKSLEFTSVASATILMSTSGIWTLLFGVIARVEYFSIRKLLGVLASLVGMVMVSSVDWTGESDEHRGEFPHKSPGEIVLGDALALASAVVYGAYSVLIKKRVGNEERVDMFLFLGGVGLINTLALWPGFFVLEWTEVEKWGLPPNGQVWKIVLINAAISFVADVCWAYAVLFSTPILVTVGLSLSIPLSMVGQMIINGQTSTVIYWIGALTVFVAFILVNSETQERIEGPESRRED